MKEHRPTTCEEGYQGYMVKGVCGTGDIVAASVVEYTFNSN